MVLADDLSYEFFILNVEGYKSGDLLSILWKQDGHATQSHIVKRRKLRVPYVRKN